MTKGDIIISLGCNPLHLGTISLSAPWWLLHAGQRAVPGLILVPCCADEGVGCLAEGCRTLQYLNLTWCIKITDTGLQKVAECCRSLRWLSLHGLRGITGGGLECLSSSGPARLHTLDVQGCGLDADSRARLPQLFPRVQTWKVHS